MQFRTPLLLHEVVPSATQVETKRVPLVRCPLIVTICLLVLLLITVTAARLFSIRSQHLTTSISQVPSQTVGTTARTTASASQVPLQTVTATTKTTTLSSTDKKTTTDDESTTTAIPRPSTPTQNVSKSVVAGGESRGSSIDELNQPTGIALDSEHNLYVLDTGNLRVVKYALSSKIKEVILGHSVKRYPKPSSLQGLLIDNNDVLYTHQSNSEGQGCVVRWPAESVNGTELMQTLAGMGFAIDHDLNIYAAWGVNLWIYLAPTYKKSISKRVFGEPMIDGTLPYCTTSIYVDTEKNLFAIDMDNYRVQKMGFEDQYSDTVLKVNPSPYAITGDSRGYLYTIDTQASLIIYNSSGAVVSAINHVLDDPRSSKYWLFTYSDTNSKEYLPNHFATVALDRKTGDLYAIMYGYDQVVKLTFI